MRHKVSLTMLILFAVFALSETIPVGATPARQEGGNLLTNPSFEPPFIPMNASDASGFYANGWNPWYRHHSADDDPCMYRGPEYKEANISVAPNRVHSGTTAQQIFTYYGTHIGGVYQRVHVPANSHLRFSVWGHSWSTTGDNPYDSHDGGIGHMQMRVGIDPTGGTDPWSASIVWGAAREVYDVFELFSVEAVAQGDYVTVYTYSAPQYCTLHNDVYWDDAGLVVIGEGASESSGSATTEPSASSSSSSASSGGSSSGCSTAYNPETQADGSIVHVVQPGDTLMCIGWVYDTDAQTLRDLNNISGSLIYIGQRLIVSPAAGGGAAAPESTPEPEAPASGSGEETAGAATEETTPASEEVAEQPEAPPQTGTGGRICARIFEDTDQDFLFSESEQPLSGGTIILSGTVSNSTTTTGGREHFCFEDLPPGDYVLSIEPPPGYQAGSLSQIPVTLTGASDVRLDFPVTGAVAQPEDSGENQEGAATSSNRGVVIAIVAGVVLVGGGMVAAYFLLVRRRAAGSL
jgi:LysM repeat protein